jgi:glutaredoxin-like protein
MPILQQRDRETVQQRFDIELKRDVNLTLYTQANIGLYIPGRECKSCGPTQELVEEVSALSPRIHLEVVDIYKSREEASSRGVDRIPALTIGNGKRDNVRFYGLPTGLEFALLVESIIAASDNRSSLRLETRRQLRALPEDVHIQVFVTPNCQYCPTVARVAHAMAMESPRVTADVIEIQEFPDLARRYAVMGVPKTVINDRVQITGAVPEEALLRRVLQAVGAIEPDEDGAEQVSNQTTLIV